MRELLRRMWTWFWPPKCPTCGHDRWSHTGCGGRLGCVHGFCDGAQCTCPGWPS